METHGERETRQKKHDIEEARSLVKRKHHKRRALLNKRTKERTTARDLALVGDLADVVAGGLVVADEEEVAIALGGTAANVLGGRPHDLGVVTELHEVGGADLDAAAVVLPGNQWS